MPASVFRKTVITRLLDQSVFPAYVLDDRRRIVYANAALADWLNVERNSLAGAACDFVATSDSLVSGLAVPPSVFRGQSTDAWIHSPLLPQDAQTVAEGTAGPSRDDPDTPAIVGGAEPSESSGRPTRQKARFLPLFGPEASVIGVLVLVMGTDSGKDAGDAESDDGVEQGLHELLLRARRRDAMASGVVSLLGMSPGTRRARRQFQMAIQSEASVLISSHHGYEAEQLARAIHAGRHPMGETGLVPFRCGLLDAELVRTTLTAFIQRCAELKSESPPTLLLLDVEQLEEDAQRELADFLTIEELNIKSLSTSCLSFHELSTRGAMREELIASLATLEIILTRLKDRSSDIPLMAQSVLEAHNAQARQQLEGFSTDAMEHLVVYPWPGDIAELEKVVAKAAHCARESSATHIGVSDLPREIRLGLDAVSLPGVEASRVDLETLLADVERACLIKTLQETRQNRAEAARRLGISRNRLLRRITQLGLDDEPLKGSTPSGVEPRPQGSTETPPGDATEPGDVP